MKIKSIYIYLLVTLITLLCIASDSAKKLKKSDLYQNPIIPYDYSDPDVIRVDDDYYMTASSFNCIPGLPILHSRDMLNWSIIGYALDRLKPKSFFDKPQHGCGVWAPSLRYHNNKFWIYYGDPDQGIFMINSKNIKGPWSEPILIEEGKGLIDPCPFWENDSANSSAYIVHAYAKSRAGFNGILILKKMNSDGTSILDEGKVIFTGGLENPTVEGPKIYKRNGYYYIFAPAGGVKSGWQLALRSKSIEGPYDVKKILHQGSTNINGPHQGAWIQTPLGQSWFYHFQEKDPFGRILHLQPLEWIADWPVIGIDLENKGIGEPVNSFTKPDIIPDQTNLNMPMSDDFFKSMPGIQWQWHANPKLTWLNNIPEANFLKLNSVPIPDSFVNLSQVPNLLLQKLPAFPIRAITKLIFKPSHTEDKCGFLIMGSDYAYLGIEARGKEIILIFTECFDAFQNSTEIIEEIGVLNSSEVFLSIRVNQNASCTFGYSYDGINFKEIRKSFTAKPGKWIGAKLGLFCIGNESAEYGHVLIDWVRIEKISN